MKKLTAILLALVLVFSLSSTAFAADVGTVGADGTFAATTNDASTDVYLKVGEEAMANLSATVPLKVTLAVKANGDIVAPANTAYKITNNSKFPVKVTNVKTVAETGYSFVTAHATANNELLLTLKPGNGTAVNLSTLTGGAAVTATDWNAAANGGTIGLLFAGSVSNLQADITATDGVKAFTVTYTIAAGTHVAA